MPDETDPPRKVYGLKERAFKRDNPPASTAPPAPTARDLAKMAGPTIPAAPRTPGAARTGDPNDVYTVLRQNLAKEKQSGLNEVEIKQVKSRRQRDFWLVLVGGNLVILGAAFVSGLTVITVIFGLAGLIIFSLGLSWVMWQVMDKY